MKITCQSCQAKYTIADDKVLGKIVKIRCKKCNETIVVNGSDPASGYTPEPAGAYGADDAWTVNVGDGDQRTMTDGEIVAAYQAGVVGDDTFCWKDGMGDWLPLRDIDQLVDQCNATRAAVSASIPPEENATRMLNNAAAAGSPAAYAAGANGSGANAFPQAARRAGGRGGADLFRGVAQAGSEEEVMTSAPSHMPEARIDEKPTGARNENSVLFSLAALTSKGQSDRPAPMPGSEQSGLIDIRQLSAQMGQIAEKKQSRVDDIMNLTSGASYNQALSAPVLSAPALDQYGAGDAGAAASAGRPKTLLFAVIGGAFIIAAGVGATVMFARGNGDTAKAENEGTAASASAGATASAATRVATVQVASGAPQATTAAPAATAATATTGATAAAAAATATPAAPAAAAPAAQPAAVAATPRAQPAAAAAAPAVAKAAAAPAPAPEADQPFNMGEAKSRLAAAAAAVQACKKADGPTGTAKVVVLFAPAGGAQSATISGPPFEGTPTGACVAARFRGVHVPAFSGSPFSVSKSFTIN